MFKFSPLIVLFCCLRAALAAAVPLPSDIAALAAQAAQAPQRTPRPYDERGWLERFYAPRNYAPAWTPAKAAKAIALLDDAPAHGLPPDDYGAATLDAGVATAASETALTAAMLHYLADLHVGHVRSEYHTTMPDPRLNSFDPVDQLRAALQRDQLAATVDAAEPQLPLYRRVRATLARYRELASHGQPVLPRAVKVAPDGHYAGAQALRERLMLLGDLADDAAPADDAHYSEALAEGVRQFQRRHGLADNGILDKATIAALNVPLSHRVRQLELTLERLRWLPDFAPGPVIAVNLPAYRLWAFNTADPGVEPLEMRVIVGKAVKTQTPLFVGQMRYLEFNPYWNVPRSIELGEILPKLARDPHYLAKNDMEIVALGNGAPASVEALRAGKARVRQKPGPQNALGAVKFAMPNPMNIYLHSTSARELFQRQRRDLSHGCIRVEKPEALAAFVLGDQPQWTPERIAAAMAPGPTRTVNLTRPIPVVLFYATAIVGRDGKAVFAEDIYRRDPRLEAALRAD